MKITDIIGKDKAFEPPFKVEYSPIYHELFLRDANDNLLFVSGDLRQMNYCEQNIFIYHICDLLNREHCKEGGE